MRSCQVDKGAIRLTANRPPTYSDGMISEFQDLSDKIDRLAALMHELRQENAVLRKSNDVLIRDNLEYMRRLSAAQERVQALLSELPPDDVPYSGEHQQEGGNA